MKMKRWEWYALLSVVVLSFYVLRMVIHKRPAQYRSTPKLLSGNLVVSNANTSAVTSEVAARMVLHIGIGRLLRSNLDESTSLASADYQIQPEYSDVFLTNVVHISFIKSTLTNNLPQTAILVLCHIGKGRYMAVGYDARLGIVPDTMENRMRLLHRDWRSVAQAFEAHRFKQGDAMAFARAFLANKGEWNDQMQLEAKRFAFFWIVTVRKTKTSVGSWSSLLIIVTDCGDIIDERDL